MKTNYQILKLIMFFYLALSPNIIGQTNEIGLFAGGTLFHGDVGGNQIESIQNTTKPTLGITYKKNINYYLSIDLTIKRGEIYANDQNSNDPFETKRNLSFKSNITEIGIIAELNFRPYLSRDENYQKTPCMFIGLSQFIFNPKGQDSEGAWHNLMAIGTEGQQSDMYPGRSPYKLHGIAIPFGLGYKIRASNFITININLGWRLTFTDYIDDVSTTYIDENILDELGTELADKSYSGMSEGFQRGDPFNNDKFGFFGVSILYSIKDLVEECDNIVF
jgi:hypothetical protein